MPHLHLLFNHALTPDQERDARTSWGVDTIVSLPQALQNLWSAIPPELDALDTYLAPIIEHLDREARERDLLLVQGDFGATYIVVRYALERSLVPLYATTRRESVDEVVEGKVVKRSLFSHVRFRTYTQG